MILFVQPFGLHSPTGGPRILRALLEDAPERFLSVCTSPQAPPSATVGPEVHVPLRPHFGRIERTRFAPLPSYLEPEFARGFRRRLEWICRENGAQAIHAIPHGLDFWYAFQAARSLGLPFYLNVHDDLMYTLSVGGNPYRKRAAQWLARAWQDARERFVICDALGQEYCRRYGKRSYLVVTDGLPDGAAAAMQPRARDRDGGGDRDRLRVYFAGALHLSYQQNFEALLDGMALLKRRRPGCAASLTCRGGSVPARSMEVPVRVLPWAGEAEVARDLDEADLLYLPLPFGGRYDGFVRFSLSTKMITYLGSGLPILYHGPAQAAAGTLLAEHDAAVRLSTLDPQNVADVLERAGLMGNEVTRNALQLGSRAFRLSDQRQRFWGALAARHESASPQPSLPARHAQAV